MSRKSPTMTWGEHSVRQAKASQRLRGLGVLTSARGFIRAQKVPKKWIGTPLEWAEFAAKLQLLFKRRLVRTDPVIVPPRIHA